MVRRGGLEPPRCYPLAPQASASANSAISAIHGSLCNLLLLRRRLLLLGLLLLSSRRRRDHRNLDILWLAGLAALNRRHRDRRSLTWLSLLLLCGRGFARFI